MYIPAKKWCLGLTDVFPHVLCLFFSFSFLLLFLIECNGKEALKILYGNQNLTKKLRSLNNTMNKCSINYSPSM